MRFRPIQYKQADGGPSGEIEFIPGHWVDRRGVPQVAFNPHRPAKPAA